MFCPICGCEYKEGIIKCFDCDAELIVELPEDFGHEELSDTEALMESYDKDETTVYAPYVSKSQRAEDNKSSAYAMLLVGGLGLIVMVLIITGVIPLHLYGNGMYLSYGVMIVLFVAFLIIGVRSLLLTKQYLIDAEIENNLNDDIVNWFNTSFSAKEIDSDCYKTGEISELDDALLYYKRSDNIKEKIKAKYVDLDLAFLDKLTDEIYECLYEDENS